MNIYAYREEFLPRIIEIFKGSVRHVCAADYSAVQTAAWLGGADYSAWDARFKGSNTFVAEEDGKIVAFGNIRQQDGGPRRRNCPLQQNGGHIWPGYRRTLLCNGAALLSFARVPYRARKHRRPLRRAA